MIVLTHGWITAYHHEHYWNTTWRPRVESNVSPTRRHSVHSEVPQPPTAIVSLPQWGSITRQQIPLVLAGFTCPSFPRSRVSVASPIPLSLPCAIRIFSHSTLFRTWAPPPHFTLIYSALCSLLTTPLFVWPRKSIGKRTELLLSQRSWLDVLWM